jgi:uncharacterized protein YegL
MSEQVPFSYEPSLAAFEPEMALNPEPRLACVLLLDVSHSMGGAPIAQLNEGLRAYKDELVADSLALKRVEVAVVTFGGAVQSICDFTIAEDFQPPKLKAGGDTPMGAAINQALDMLDQRKGLYKSQGLAYFRPWVFLITDGAPTDKWQSAAQRVHEGEENKAFVFFAVGVEGANFDILQKISVREPLKLDGLRFRDLFQWLSASHRSLSHSTPSEQGVVKLPPPGWLSLD